MIRRIVLACLSCLLVLALGCQIKEEGKGMPTEIAAPQNQMAGQSAPTGEPVDRRLIGTWGEDMGGGSNLIYSFRADGTFRRIILSKGIMNGLGTEDGYYTVSGDLLILHGTRDSWKPMAAGQPPGYSDQPINTNERKRIRQANPAMLNLIDETTGFTDSLTRRREP
jgi:hypothetical protein